MKNAFKPFILGCLALTGYINGVQAQDVSFASTSDLLNDPKSLLAVASNKFFSNAIPVATVNEKVLRSFNKSFKNTSNVTWYTLNKKFLALFSWDGVMAHALLGKNGWIIYDIRYGTEKNLPKDIRKTLKMNYVDYKIGSAIEVNVAGKNAWVVNLEDDNNLVQARVMDGDLDEMARYVTHPEQKKLHRKGRIIIPKE